MGALKWLVVTVCGLLAVGLAGLGVKSSLRLREQNASPLVIAKLSMRPLPPVFVTGATVVPPKTPVEPPAHVVEAADAGAPVKIDAGVAAKSDAGTPAAAGVVAAKPDAEAAAPPVPKPAVVDAGVKPVPVAPVPAPAPVAPPPAAAAASDAVLNLRASDTADVFVDGKRVGSSPVLGVKVKAGAHKIRFDCYDAAGNTVAGAVQTVTATAENEVDVTFPCPASE